MKWDALDRMVYGLVDPRDCTIRYVGKSSLGFDRPSAHLHPGRLRERSKKNSWIKGLLKRNLRPGVRVLCVLRQDDDMTKEEAEGNILDAERFFIRKLKESGARLLNGTQGGDGGDTGGGRKRRRGVVGTNIVTGVTKAYKFVLQTADDGFAPSKVVAVCRGRRISHRGHVFRYANGNPPPRRASRCLRPVRLLAPDGSVSAFESVKAAAAFLGVQPSYISLALRKGWKIRGRIIERTSKATEVEPR